MTTTLAYIGLGANLGDAAHSVRLAARQLADASGITQLTLSPLYRTTPVDSSGHDYVNAVAAVHTTLTANQLLALMQAML